MTFASRITGASLDPYYSKVALMAHMSGANGSTTFIDTSPVTKTLTANGNVVISNAQAKFGTTSGYFDGASDYIKLSSNIALSTSENWTIEFWERHSTGTSVTVGYDGSTKINFIAAGTGLSGINGAVLGSSTSISSSIFSGGSAAANQWNWVALSYSVGVGGIYVYINGTYTNLLYGTGNFTVEDIGGYKGSYPDFAFNGYMCEMRITKGVARYSGTGSLAVPTSPFPDF
jgi:hypothetical protein